MLEAALPVGFIAWSSACTRVPTRLAVSPAQSKTGVSSRSAGGADMAGDEKAPSSTRGAQFLGTRARGPPRGAPESRPGADLGIAARSSGANSAPNTGQITASRLPARGDHVSAGPPTVAVSRSRPFARVQATYS